MKPHCALLVMLCFFPVVAIAEHGPKKPAFGRPEYQLDPALRSSVEYNYRYALGNPSIDSLKIKIDLRDSEFPKGNQHVYAVIKYFDLSNDSEVKEATLWVKTDGKAAYVELPNLRPDAVYQADISLYQSDRESGKNSLIKHAGKYWGATADKDDLSLARHRFVTTMFLERQDWAVGRRHGGNAPYTGMSGGWCGQFPFWCGAPYFKVSAEEMSADYRANGKLLYGGEAFKKQAVSESIHGNYATWTANGNYHKMTVLGYSPKSGTVYTIEGNFGGGIGVTTRRPSEIGHYGVLTPGMLWRSKTIALEERP